MEHSKNYMKIRNWYKTGLWTKNRVHDAVIKGFITTAEYKEITGEDYA